MPRFSILIPAFNAEQSIGTALDALLAQEMLDFEIIIVNDGSTDATASRAESYLERFASRGIRLTLINQENQGAGFALKRAASHALGEFLIMHGADDYLAADHLARVQNFMTANPGYDIYAANARYFSASGDRGSYHPHKAPYDRVFSLSFADLIEANGIYGTAAIRRSLYEQVGGFDTRFYNEDYQLWLKLLLAGARHIYQPKELSLYRVKAGQKTGDALAVRADDIKILRSFLEEEKLAKSSKDLIEKRIKALELNLRIRAILYRILGKDLSESLIRFLRG